VSCLGIGLLGLEDTTTANTTSSASGNQTNLGSGRSIARHSGGVTHVLVVTTTVRVLNGVHGHTSHNGPDVALDLVLVIRTTSLQDRLVNTTATSNQTDHSAAGRQDALLGARGETQPCLAGIFVVRDDGGIVTRATSELSTIARVVLGVANDGTLRHGIEGEDVANLQLSSLAAVQELTAVNTLSSDEHLLDLLELVGVSEDDLSEGSSTSRVVNDLLDDTLDVAMSLSVVEGAELGSTLATD